MRLFHVLWVAVAFLVPSSLMLLGASDKPNIIFILADDLGYGELGCYGQTKIETPHIDQLSEDGMRFTQYYSGSPVCAPARCTFLTGKHSGHAQVRGNYQVGSWNMGSQETGQFALSSETENLAKLLQGEGYKTACIGKWGLGTYGSSGAPDKQGFDHFFGYICQLQAHTHYPNHLWRNGEVLEFPGEEGKQEHSHDLLTKEALQFVDEASEEPFFLYLAYAVPHLSNQATEDEIAKYRGRWEEVPFEGKHYTAQKEPRAAYAAMVSMMDRDVGKLVALLKEKGLDEDTVVIFSSDNGPTFSSHGADTEFFKGAGPWRGVKGQVYEGGLRVPFIVKWPGVVKAGTVSSHLCALWDLYPTFAELGGVKKLPGDIDGLSMLPSWKGQQAQQKQHELLYWELRGQQAMRHGPWKVVKPGLKKGYELYHLPSDPGELHDLSKSMGNKKKELVTMLEGARTESEIFPLDYNLWKGVSYKNKKKKK